MKHLRTITAALMLLFSASAAQAEDADFAKMLDGLMPKLSAEKIADRHGAQKTLLSTCLKLGAPGKEKQRAEACSVIAKKLGSNMAVPARVWLLKQLEFIGLAESVDAVAALLGEKDTLVRDAARRALANNPEKAAGAKLLARMPSEKDAKFKAALINSLGYRAEASSVSALSTELANKDQTVAIAAARALGKIATPDAAKSLSAAREKAAGELKLWIGDSLLLCADDLKKQGKSAEAIALYKQLSGPKESKHVRVAALQGLLQAGKKVGGK